MAKLLRKKSTAKSLLLVVICGLLVIGGLYLENASANEVSDGKQLTKMGPISSENGFPVWFKDSAGTRLQLCLDANDPLCAILPEDVPDPSKPISFPDNFPSEAFYQLAGAEMETGTGGRVVANFQLEAAFTQEVPTDGQQMIFGRIRFRIEGIKAHETYKITHPYGVDILTAEPDKKNPDLGEIRFTQDIGDMGGGNPQLALTSRIGTFLKWDPDVKPDAPPGYIGDPNENHRVVGSVFIDVKTKKPQNFLRVEGPGIAVGTNGVFSTFACEEPNPNNPNQTIKNPDCIEVHDFSLMGKIATNNGVEIQQATYERVDETGGTIDVFAYSEESNQSIEVSGTGFDPVRMAGGNGQYFARLSFSGETVPERILVTNKGDSPVSSKEIKLVDKITAAALYDIDNKTLTFNAESSDKAGSPQLEVKGYGLLEGGTLVITDQHYVPPSFTIKSSMGGTLIVPVTITGSSFTSMPVVAFAGSNQTVIKGNMVTLDGSSSTGPIKSWSWKQLSGTEVELSGADTATPSFTAPSSEEELEFELTITGPADSVSSTVKVKVLDSAPDSIADAGPDQEVEQNSVVSLNGSGSENTTKFNWRQIGGPEVVLNGENTPTPTFTFPKKAVTLTFELTATGAGGATSTDTVEITAKPDVLTVSSAEYRRDKREWRIDGTSTVFGLGVEVTFYIGSPANNKVVAKGLVDTLGAFRYRGTGVAITAGETLTIVSSAGGVLENVRVTIK
ncbi:PKD domain-containing protein [Neobacillus sp. SCS-31]|uniref:PKD domain-containing protein n=1 Tax=Neobacillus oceani TaxID=3115292 RepID=UPI003905A28D